MINGFRAFTKTWTFKILMGILALSFVVVGGSQLDVLSAASGNSVIKAGAREVSAQDYTQAFDNYKKNVQQESGQTITNEDAVNQGLHVRLLEEMASMESLSSYLEKSGIKPSAKMVVDQLRKYPMFFDSITNRFDEDKYTQFLGQQGLTNTKFEQLIRDDIAANHFGNAAAAGMKLPRVYGALAAAYGMENRDVSLFILSPANVEQPAQPNDAQLTAFYNENKERLRRPEFRQFSLVTFAPKDLMASIAVDEAELKKRYEFKRDTMSQAETRTLIQISAKDAKSASAAEAALKAGQSPEVAAKASGGQVLVYDNKPKTAIPDKKIADAAFALAQGAVSAPIQGDLGFAILKVTGITAGSVPSFDAVKAQLTEEYRQEKATEVVYERVEAFEKARAAGDSIEAAAKKLNLNIADLPPMTAEGQAINGQNYAQFAQVIKVAFDQPKGGESEVQELGNGEYFAVRVNEIAPSEVPTLDQVKPQMVQAYMQQKMMDAVRIKADSVTERLRKGENFNTVAESVKAPVEAVKGLDRQTGQQKVGPQIAARVFSAKKGETFSAQASEYAYVIGRVDTITAPEASLANVNSVLAQRGLTQATFRDVEDMSRTSTRTLLKTKTYPQTAIRALGVTPPAKTDATPATPEKK
ncbi:peptidyl-prolyl cis-trans isomerase [Asticcacaulis machinosus]|uniref:Parvulin-like PPIase n=1 Tax=Asticcacaulis machinosus TaxID=2984211 RepID=A0ABT5HEX3_9CAUL|nr:peptidyl-prolyl cis-trans isomerase [Asticcacaulis machinosus]MDC7674805.1 peptidyl-prolyl cis-trans isomerase [Asticcacaulis machinosus]